MLGIREAKSANTVTYITRLAGSTLIPVTATPTAQRPCLPQFYGGGVCRLDDYDEYINRQKWIRETFGGGPLEIEFRLWLGEEI